MQTNEQKTFQQGNFKEFVDSIKQKVTQTFNTEGKILPTWFFLLKDNSIVELVTPFRNNFEKDIIDKAIRKVVVAKDVQRYAFTSEVWYAISIERYVKKLSDYKGLPPSKRPDRKEALMLVAEDKAGEGLIGRSDIHRGGDLAMVGEFKMVSNKDNFEGRFMSMFSKS